jgi:hypothetical protein
VVEPKTEPLPKSKCTGEDLTQPLIESLDMVGGCAAAAADDARAHSGPTARAFEILCGRVFIGE